MTAVLMLAVGLVGLVIGGELLVRGAAGLASRLGLSPLVIGLTVVAFGTSSPELAVSVIAALGGGTDLALGNVVGSNILNVLLILGVSALIVPLVVSRQLVRIDVPIMIGASLLAVLLGVDGRIGRADGVLLMLGLAGYLVLQVWLGRRAPAVETPADAPAVATRGLAVLLLLVAGGLVVLVLGSRAFLTGAVSLARAAGLSELVIGLTLVALGTSLPEVATSILAAVRGQRDIAVGNVIGSNIFNLSCVLGVTATVKPVPVAAAALGFDLPVMLAVALACLPIFFTGHLIARWEGALFLGYYIAYIAFVILAAQHHDAAAPLGRFVLVFALPLTVITLVVLGLRALRAR